jgi:hypothetical protein
MHKPPLKLDHLSYEESQLFCISASSCRRCHTLLLFMGCHTQLTAFTSNRQQSNTAWTTACNTRSVLPLPMVCGEGLKTFNMCHYTGYPLHMLPTWYLGHQECCWVVLLLRLRVLNTLIWTLHSRSVSREAYAAGMVCSWHEQTLALPMLNGTSIAKATTMSCRGGDAGVCQHTAQPYPHL